MSYKVNGTEVEPIITTYFAGSVTPFTNENPGFRVYEIDSVVCFNNIILLFVHLLLTVILQTKAIIDYTEYAINLTQANIDGFPAWRPMYPFFFPFIF